MSLRDCLNSAVEQGAISSRQADEMHRYYEARFNAKRAGMDERRAATEARAEVAAELRGQAREKKRQALLAEGKRKELAAYFGSFRNLYGNANLTDAALSKMIHYGYKGTESMQARYHGIMSLVQRDLADAMHHFSRTAITGRRRGKADLPDIVRELNHEATGNAAAKALAASIRGVREDLRLRFNAAGGNIPKRQDFDLTHTHDAAAILRLGQTPDEARAAWKRFVTPLLDPDQMTNPVTGATVGAAGLDASLDHVFASIVSDGWANRKPEARRFGMGPIASRYQDARFLQFRNADSWLAYNDRFGTRDPVTAIFGQIKALANDIAAMETFGPNPDAMVEWMKQAIQHEAGKSIAGKASLLKAAGLDTGKRAADRIDTLWRAMRGRETVWSAPAQFAADIRNVATSAMLGATSILAAATDPVIAAQARLLAGLPLTLEAHNVVKAIASRGDRLEASRAAILWDDYLHMMNEELRFADQVFGHEWSKYLADRALHWNGLIPLSNARKRIEATAWHETLGGFAAKDTPWEKLPALTVKAMEGFGLTAADWAKMKKGVDADGFLSPAGIADAGQRRVAEKYAGFIAQWGERSVPSGDIRIKSAINRSQPRGTLPGEILDFATQFMSFGLSYTARQIEATYVMAMAANTKSGRVLRGAGYAGAGGVALAIGAAVHIQLLSIIDGKDPEDMTTPSFWLKAYVKGGGGGLFADFFARSESKFGQSFTETLPGPGWSLISDGLDMTFGSFMRAFQEEEQPPVGRKVADYAGRYTPVLSSHPATRLAYRRLFVDQLHWLADPAADKRFKAKKKRASHWWEPGETGPARAPDVSTAGGAR